MVRALDREMEAYRAVQMGELEIDLEGRIWRVAARRWDRWHKATRTIRCERRRAEKSAGKYLQVRVMFGKQRIHALAHRMVWLHFNGPIPPGLTVNHEDGDTTNNRPDNLTLATYAEQQIHSLHVLGHTRARDSLGRFCPGSSRAARPAPAPDP